MQDRAAALTAVAAHLWKIGNTARKPQPAETSSARSPLSGAVSSSPATQDRAFPNSPAAQARAAPTSPRAQGRAVPTSPRAQGKAVPNSPTAASRPQAKRQSSREQLQGIATTAAGIRADIDAATAAAAAAAADAAAAPDASAHASLLTLPGNAEAGATSQLEAGAVSQHGSETITGSLAALPGQSEAGNAASQPKAEAASQHRSETITGLSDREARAAARASKASQKAKQKAADHQVKGKLSGQLDTPEGQGSIPQSDGAGDEEEAPYHSSGMDTNESNANVAGSNSAAGEDTSVAHAVPDPFSSLAPVSTVAATSALSHILQNPGLSRLGSDSSAVARTGSPHADPTYHHTDRAAANSPHSPSALEQMAARYLNPSSSSATPLDPHMSSASAKPVPLAVTDPLVPSSSQDLPFIASTQLEPNTSAQLQGAARGHAQASSSQPNVSAKAQDSLSTQAQASSSPPIVSARDHANAHACTQDDASFPGAKQPGQMAVFDSTPSQCLGLTAASQQQSAAHQPAVVAAPSVSVPNQT